MSGTQEKKAFQKGMIGGLSEFWQLGLVIRRLLEILGKAILVVGLGMKTRLATVEENIEGKEAKTESLDNFFKEFRSTRDQRIREEHDVQ